MKCRSLGRTGLQVSETSLGTVEIGMDYGIPVEGEALRPAGKETDHLLNRTLDMGINFIDTAWLYEESETLIGRALKGRRSEYILATKVPHFADEGLTGQSLRQKIEDAIASSLRALQTDVIDLLYIHSVPEEVLQRGEVADILEDAKRAGQVRFIGATTYGEAAALAVLADGRYDCLQIAYNALDRLLEERVMPLAQEKGVGLVIRSVLLKGALTYRHAHLPAELGALKSAVAQLESLADAKGISLPELAYRFVLAHPAVSSALVGTGRLSELEMVLAYAEAGPLSPSLLAQVNSIEIKDTSQVNPGNWPITEKY